MNLAHPAVQSGLLPLVVGLAAAGLLRLPGAASGRAEGAASAALPLALLLSALAVLGLPPLLPHTALHKLVYLVAAGLVLGLVADWLGAGRRGGLGIAFAMLALGAVWIAWPLLDQPAAAAKLGGVGVAGALILTRLSVLAPRSGQAPALLLVACLGLAAVAGLSGSLVIGQLAGALGAGVAGFAAWSGRVRFAAGGLVGGVAWLLLALLALLLTDASALAVAPLGLVFLADRVSARIPIGRRAAATARGHDNPPDWPGLARLVALAALPVAAAIAIALALGAGGSASPYYR